MRDRWHRGRALALGALLIAPGCGLWSTPPEAQATSFLVCDLNGLARLTLQRWEEIGDDGEVVQTLDRLTPIGGENWRQQVEAKESGVYFDSVAARGLSLQLLRDRALVFWFKTDCDVDAGEVCDDT